ncbi:hypothetical protein DPMN_125936 [Dreissena polymorpha]|uniref:Uncharacterized protein n=1 Tax=Dreissena polymorpha TaxID=45954 RepID=A0A9D4GW65_DREPO|nr:hypothetical protein DPMN_125936 [Dreissena polymorpha]
MAMKNSNTPSLEHWTIGRVGQKVALENGSRKIKFSRGAAKARIIDVNLCSDRFSKIIIFDDAGSASSKV